MAATGKPKRARITLTVVAEVQADGTLGEWVSDYEVRTNHGADVRPLTGPLLQAAGEAVLQHQAEEGQ